MEADSIRVSSHCPPPESLSRRLFVRFIPVAWDEVFAIPQRDCMVRLAVEGAARVPALRRRALCASAHAEARRGVSFRVSWKMKTGLASHPGSSRS